MKSGKKFYRDVEAVLQSVHTLLPACRQITSTFLLPCMYVIWQEVLFYVELFHTEPALRECHPLLYFSKCSILSVMLSYAAR